MGNGKTDGKEAFLAAVAEMVDMLPIDWSKVDVDNPYPPPTDSPEPN